MPDERCYTKYACNNSNCKHICKWMNSTDNHSKPCCKCNQPMSITSDVISIVFKLNLNLNAMIFPQTEKLQARILQWIFTKWITVLNFDKIDCFNQIILNYKCIFTKNAYKKPILKIY